jgi:hypothetical protein
VAVTVVGSHGHARVVLGGGWEVVTARGARSAGGPDTAPQEPRHLALLGDWLDDPAAVHPASFAASYRGFEVLLGLALSSVEHRPVALPIEDHRDDILQRLDGLLAGADQDRNS